MQRLGTIGLGLQGSFNRLNLPGNAPNPIEQLAFVFVCVRHTYTPYPYLTSMIAAPIEAGKVRFRPPVVA